MTYQGRAAEYLAKVNLGIIKAAASRRGMGGTGARPPASIAGQAVRLVVLDEAAPGVLNAKGKVETSEPARVTSAGYQTAVRALPRALACLKQDDPRHHVAVMLADTAERLSGARGADLEGSAPKGVISDGGASTRMKYAERMRRMEALANRWDIGPSGRVSRGPSRLIVEVGRQTGKLKEIGAFQSVVAMCCHGLSADEILRRHGWATKSKARRKLIDGVLDTLDVMAEGMGFGKSS